MHHSGSTVLGTVIIVDDDPSVRASLERMLRLEGHRPLSYDCAEAFLASTLPDTPACVLLDVLLPDHDGFSVQQSVARTHRHIPIIFLSGHGDVPMTVRAMKGGRRTSLRNRMIRAPCSRACRARWRRVSG